MHERHDVHRAAAHGSRRTRRRASRASRPGRASCWSGRRRARAPSRCRSASPRARRRPGRRGRGSCWGAWPRPACVNVPAPTSRSRARRTPPRSRRTRRRRRAGELRDLVHPRRQTGVGGVAGVVDGRRRGHAAGPFDRGVPAVPERAPTRGRGPHLQRMAARASVYRVARCRRLSRGVRRHGPGSRRPRSPSIPPRRRPGVGSGGGAPVSV